MHESGVMVMKMEEGLDTGPMAMAERVPIAADATAGDLHDRLARLGADLMVRALGAIERGDAHAHAAARSRRDLCAQDRQGRNPDRLGAAVEEVHDHIRGLSPFPGAWFEIAGEGARASRCCGRREGEGTGPPGTVLDDRLTVACADGAVRILELQRAGRQAMKADEFLRGTPLPPGPGSVRPLVPLRFPRPRIFAGSMRYKLTIEYDGTPFVGWQIQDNGPSVQGVLARARSKFCGEMVSVHGAGRTDAGVHALGQVGHLDLAKRLGGGHGARRLECAFAPASGRGHRG